MTDILFTANGASATVLVNGELTSGMVGVPVRFAFDSDWDGLNIVAVFDGGGHRISVPLLTDMEAVLPWEVIAKANTRLRIGAEGRKSDGSVVVPTVWANAGYIREGAAATDDEGNPPTPGIYDQIMAAIEAGKLQGKPGEDGVSPTVSVTEIEGGHRVTITDANGTQVFDVMDGSGFDIEIADDLDTKDPNIALSANMGAALRDKIDNDLLTVQKGLQAEIKQRVKTVNGAAPDENGNVVVQGGSGGSGEPGEDGFSPVANVTQTASGAVITITDKSGTTTATIVNGKDGVDGKDGKDGAQGVQGEKGETGAQGEPGKDGSNGKDGVSATHSWNGTTLTITSASGTSSANLKGDKGDQGIQGEQGPKGDTGSTGSQGPKGDKGDTGATGSAGVSVSSVTQTTASTADGGSNVITVTLSNGNTSTFTVKNGSKGSTGATGATGATGSKGDKGDKGDPGDDYVLTAGDKADIAALVIQTLGGSPIFGVVDSSNNIVVSGNLPDGAYSVKYEMENGNKVNIGNLVIDTNVYYTVTNTLTQCTTNNSATKAVQGGSYSATITAKSGYELKSIVVKMGGTDISSTAVSGGKITISNVTGNIVITAVAEQKTVQPVTQNLTLEKDISIELSAGANRGSASAGFCAMSFVDLSSIPKPCTIKLTGAKWAFATASETGYIRFFIANTSGEKLAGDYTHPSKMPSGVTMTNDGDSGCTVTVTGSNIGKLRFVGCYTQDPGTGNFTDAKATLTYTPNS